MPLAKVVDEELSILENRDLDIRNDLSILQFKRRVQHPALTDRELGQSFDLKQIVGVTKLLQ